MTADLPTPLSPPATRPSNVVLIVGMVLYTGFAIPVSIVAMAFFFPAGIALAAFFAWQWTRLPAILSGTAAAAQVPAVTPQVPQPESTGNRSFDAYRAELLNRLEREQHSFDGFVTRLREAKDRSEFDQFMDERAAANRTPAQD